jgi:hypothetical protein
LFIYEGNWKVEWEKANWFLLRNGKNHGGMAKSFPRENEKRIEYKSWWIFNANDCFPPSEVKIKHFGRGCGESNEWSSFHLLVW